MNLSFLLFEIESNPNGYIFLLCWVIGTPEHLYLVIFHLFIYLFNKKCVRDSYYMQS